MGVKIQYGDGSIVEFDGTPSQADIDEAYQVIGGKSDALRLNDQVGKIGEYAVGAGEAALSLGSGVLGSLLAPIPAGLKALNDFSQGRETNFQKDYPAAIERMTYPPQTEAGQAIMKPVGEAINQLGIPMLGHMGNLPFSNAPMRLPGRAPKGANPGAVLEAMEKEIAPADRPSLPVGKTNPMDQLRAGVQDQALIDRLKALNDNIDAPGRSNAIQGEGVLYGDQQGVVTPQLPDQAMQMAKQRGVPEQPARSVNGEQGELFGNPELFELDGGDGSVPPRSLESFSEEQARTAAEEAQRSVDERQMNLEFETKKQHSLDFNAAERARQEAAEVPGLREAQVEQSVANNPWVEKWQEKIQKQEELITKLSEQVQNGKAPASRLAKEVKNLENFEQALERTKDNVSQGYREGKPALPFNFKRQGGGVRDPFAKDDVAKLKEEDVKPIPVRQPTQAELDLKKALSDDAKSHIGRLGSPSFWQRGAINPEVFKEGFEKIVEGAKGISYRLKSRPDPSGVLPMLDVVAMKGDQKVGEFSFYSKENDLVAAGAEVRPEFRKQGIAKGAYEAVASVGNDIVPSGLQTNSGKAMWEGFKRDGLADPHGKGYIPKKQRGAILIDPKDADKGKFLANLPSDKLKTIVPMKLTAENVVEAAKGKADVDQNTLQKIANYFTKGGQYQGLKTDNIVIKYGFEKLGEADRLARGDIQDLVHDQLGPASRELSAKEAADIWPLIDAADRLQKPLDLELLARNGFNEKQLNYVQTHRAVMDKVFDAINGARKAAGLEPIERRIAYAAMKATGDYRRVVFKLDEQGNKVVVGVVGSDFRPLLNHRVEAIEAKGYTVGPEDYFGGVPRDRGNAQREFALAIQQLADKDPNVKSFLDVLDEINKNEAYAFLNMKKHTLQKKGVFGMEGRKGEEHLVLPFRKAQRLAEMNAREGMQAQLDYAEGALKWRRLSEAIEEIRPVLNNKDINMPIAKEWVQDYVKNALGYNPSKLGHFLEQGFAQGMGATGIGYSNIRRAIAVSRKIINTSLLGLDPGFWLTNVVQPMRAMPGMKAYLITKGLDANFDFGTGYSYIAKAAITEMRANSGKPLTAVEAGAYQYAKTHYVYGSEMVEHSNRASKDLVYGFDKVGNFAAGGIESWTRRIMFLSFTDMLHQNGLSVKNGLYEAAHNLTDMTMNNYSPVERPRVYNSLGPVGEMAVNLASFKHNELSRVALFARQLKEEKSARPILVELAASTAFAGILGIAGFSAMDWLYKQITGAMGKPESLTLKVIELSEKLGHEIGGGAYALSHGGFSLMGIDMSKRMGLADITGDSIADVVFPGVSKLGNMAVAGYEAIRHPSKTNTLRAAHEMSPRPVAGNIELEAFSNGDLGNNVKTLRGGVHRTPGDRIAKRLGFTGIHESVEKNKFYEVNTIKQKYAAMREGPLHKARDELFMTGRVSEATVRAYLKPEGDINTLKADLSRFAKEQHMSAKDLALLQASMSQSISNLRHAQRLKRAYENER